MRVLAAEFLTSATDPQAGRGWPEEGPPEIAFAGRSNVGKSTLLQALVKRRGLVRISSTPGRTRLINFFRVVVAPRDQSIELRFVDLPGFGYAKVSKEERKSWFAFVEQYLGRRQSLRAVVLLTDARRVADARGGAAEEGGALFDEAELARWLDGRGVAVIPVATKTDKLAKHERKPAAELLRQALGAAPAMVSGSTGDGVDALWKRILIAVSART